MPAIGSYAQRVQDLLREYAELSGGRIRLQIIDPTPFEAEDRAVAFGLQKVPLDGREGGMFLGWSAPTPPMTSKPSLFFRPIASRSWNMIFRAWCTPSARPSAPSSDSQHPADQWPGALQPADRPAGNHQTLRGDGSNQRFFETRMLETDLTRVPENVTVLMVVHPKTAAADPVRDRSIRAWRRQGFRAG